MAIAPRPGSTANKGGGEAVIVVDGKRYPFRVSEITARDASDLRRATGLSVRGILAASEADPDIDIIAALMWLSRRQNGAKNLPFDAVANEIGFTTEFDIETKIGAEDEDENDPQL